MKYKKTASKGGRMPKKMAKVDIQSVLRDAIIDAIDFIDSEVSEDRNRAMKYFNGQVSIGHEKGRSKVVATKCRDVVRAIKPSLMRVFMSSTKPVEFIPKTQEDVAGAEQATQYAQWKFNESNGFRLLANALHDALIKKTGILKAFYDESKDTEIDDYTDLTDEEFAYVVNDDEVTVIEHSAHEGDIDGQPVMLHDAKVSRESHSGSVCIKSVPPEDFFVDRNATGLDDCYICGHVAELRVGDLVDMGFAFGEVVNLDADDDGDEEDYDRNGHGGDDQDENALDPSMKKVKVTEAYMRMDIEGTGIPKLYAFVCGGTNYKILSQEICDDLPFAIFEIDPEPHSFFGRSLVELIIEDQDASTSLLRGLLDNVAQINTPRTEAVEDMVNMDDLLNNEIGGIIRVKAMGMLNELSVPPIGMAVLPALQYYDDAIDGKTGVTRVSAGLNPDALQGATATAVNATTEAAMGQTEVIVRHLAEGGMKQLFKLIYRLSRKHATAEEHMRIGGQFIPVDPRSWTAGMDVQVNVGLGSGQNDARIMALREALQHQTTIWQNYGPQNGLVSLTAIRNTLADLLELQGVKSVDRYYKPMNQEIEDQMAQAVSQAPPPPDPNAAIAQAEIAKAQITAATKKESDLRRAQLDGMKAMEEADRKRSENAAKDDLERDKMDMELMLRAADLLGKYGVQVDKNHIQALQAAPRTYGG